MGGRGFKSVKPKAETPAEKETRYRGYDKSIKDYEKGDPIGIQTRNKFKAVPYYMREEVRDWAHKKITENT